MRKNHGYALAALLTCGLVASIAEAKRLPASATGASSASSLQQALREISGPVAFGDVYCRKMLQRCDDGDLWACGAWERYCVPGD